LTDRLLTLREVADILQLPPATLYAWRAAGTGPPSFRCGRWVRYKQADLASDRDRAMTSQGNGAQVIGRAMATACGGAITSSAFDGNA
jgi:predicted DNA-binding transcriptional regulator AlpA